VEIKSTLIQSDAEDTMKQSLDGKTITCTEGVALQAWIMQQKQLSEKHNQSDAYSSWRRLFQLSWKTANYPRIEILLTVSDI
jgi:hypothetical protein